MVSRVILARLEGKWVAYKQTKCAPFMSIPWTWTQVKLQVVLETSLLLFNMGVM